MGGRTPPSTRSRPPQQTPPPQAAPLPWRSAEHLWGASPLPVRLIDMSREPHDSATLSHAVHMPPCSPTPTTPATPPPTPPTRPTTTPTARSSARRAAHRAAAHRTREHLRGPLSGQLSGHYSPSGAGFQRINADRLQPKKPQCWLQIPPKSAKTRKLRAFGKRGTQESNLAQWFWRPPCYRYTSPPRSPHCRGSPDAARAARTRPHPRPRPALAPAPDAASSRPNGRLAAAPKLKPGWEPAEARVAACCVL
jgi:hypothetical protein